MLSDERAAFEAWCFANGLMAESHGVRSESRACDVAWLAWQAATAVAEAAVKAEREGQEAVAWMTHHDEPMIFLSRKEASAYCYDDEEPLPLYTRPQASAAVPEGYVLVPVEPTYEMKKQGIDVEIDHDGVILCMSFEDVSRIYRAMLSASQPGVRS